MWRESIQLVCAELSYIKISMQSECKKIETDAYLGLFKFVKILKSLLDSSKQALIKCPLHI